MFCDFPKYKHLKQTIFRGPGGGGNATSDSEVNILTTLTNQALAYSEQAGLEAGLAAASAAAASGSAFDANASAVAALASETEAALSESAAAISASNALASENASAISAATASTGASTATTQAGLAAASAAAALVSEGNAATSASTATTQAGIATTGAGTATTQAGNSSTSAAAALVSQGASAASAAAALVSQGAAATSASNALTSENNAASSASAAAASAASINDANLVHKTGNETIGGIKTFSSTIVGSVNGNAATVTTNANLTGAVTSVGNATTLSNAVVTSAKLSTDLQASTFGFKNRLINGDMRIDQRNAGAAVSADNSYPVDRFQMGKAGSQTFTAQRSTTAPTGFTNSLAITIGTGSAPAATDRLTVAQAIEGFNVSDLGWGTANALAITVSFQVRSSLTGTFGVAFRNVGGNRSYVSSFTISAANTFETKTFTIPGDTSGVWAVDSAAGLFLNFDLGCGTTFSTTAGSWLAGNFLGLTGGTKLNSTSGATFYITGVQLEKGSTATAYDFRDYGRELIMCQRYYQQLGNSSYVAIGSGRLISSTQGGFYIKYNVSFRAAPSATYSNLAITDRTVFDGIVSSIAGFTSWIDNGYLALNMPSQGQNSVPVFLVVSSGTTGYLALSAEL